MSRKPAFALFGILAVALVLFLVLREGEAPPVTVEDLTTKALDPAGEPAVRERAVLDLARKGPEGKEALKQLVRTAPDPAVKGSAILGLSEMEAWDSMPLLLDTLDDPSELVRARAGAAVAQFIGKDFGFKANAPLDQRKAIIRVVRAEYAKMAASPPPRYQNPPASGNPP